ncbi:hemicentin-1-like isoform X6 [Podarcis muralis]
MGRHEAWRPPGWRYSWHTAFLAASILSSCFLFPQAQETTGIRIRVVPEVLKEGDSVTLTPEIPYLKNLSNCKWYRGAVEVKNTIITYFLAPVIGQENGDAHTGRETGRPDCSLYITNLKPDDSGTYSFKPEGLGVTGTGATNITVSEYLSKPKVLVSPSPFLTEFETAILTCNTTPRIVSVAWFWDGLPLRESSQMQLSDANRTLTIHGINRSDAGEYRCQVSNPAYTEMSDAVYISVFFGPETPEIQPNTSVYNEHSDIQLTCTASGEPAIVYTWFINGTKYSDGSQLLIRDISVEQSGTYLCKAVNKVTRDQKNTTLEIEVVGEVRNVTISGPSNAKENDSVTLNCNSAGTNVSYYWLKGSQLIEGGGHISLDNNNQRLILNPVTRNDEANYTCFGNNSFSESSSEPHWLQIFYGPDIPTINPQDPVYRDQSTLNLSCSANSNPPANYSWYHNEKLLEAQNESQLLISHLSLNDAGKYTCNATNDATGLFSHTSLEISVLGEVRNVTISGPSNAKENDSVTLNCNSAGTNVSYYWLKGSQLIEGGGHISLDNNNQRLILNPVTRNDEANYTCFGNNSFSESSSEPHWLQIYYGPDIPTINPQEPVYIEHFPLNLSCSANSNPPANYSWYHNEKLLEAQNESQLLISHLSLNDAGKYTCNATNDATGLFSHTSLEISVLGDVRNVTISGPSNATENDSVTLNCNSAGTNVSYYWLMGSQLIEGGGHISLDNNNQRLILNPVTRNDEANYTCFGNNSFSESSSEPHWLQIFYGPDIPTINPQEPVYIEHFPLNLSCSAYSNPPANYSWYHNEKLLEAQNESQLLISHLSLNDAGKYTCNATNDVTGHFSHTSLEISVLGEVRNVTISGPSNAKENDSVTLNCNSAGTNFSYYWLKGSQLIEGGGHISLDNNNQRLILNPITRNDEANYTCFGNNSFSENSSEPHWLQIFYGPDIPTINPQEPVYIEHFPLNLSCSANSNPPANYSWYHNEKLLEAQNESQLLISHLSLNDAGKYTCNATNDATGLFSHTSLEISVLGEVRNVTISGPSNATENDSVTLNCNSAGTNVSYYWLKGSQLIEGGGHISLDNNNQRLILNPITRNDEANYTCFGNNSFSENSSEPHWLQIFYGPDIPTINPQEPVYIEHFPLNLSCSANSNPPASYSWYHNEKLLEAQNESQLLISHLSLNDAGKYTCNATNDATGHFSHTSLEISVLGYVTNITISDSGKAIENSTTVLHCTSAGTNVSYSWLRGNESLVVGERISLSNNNQVLTFNPTSRNDSDSYSCYGYNSFSNDSTSYLLNVLYGPDVPEIGPSEHYYAEGSNLTLSCTADSNPAAQYTWSFNETSDIGSASQLSIHNLQFHHSGNYTCKAFNNETNASSTSASREIWVLAEVSDVAIMGLSEAIENESLILTCTSVGSEVSYYWFRGNQSLEDGGHISLSHDNQNLTINPVSQSDAGSYTCLGVNRISNNTSTPFELTVFYGPDDPVISPKINTYRTGSSLNLSCSADSHPPPQYTWIFKEGIIGNTSELLIWNLSLNDTGDYTCSAFNVETNLSKSASLLVEVYETLSNPVLWPAEAIVVENASVSLQCNTSNRLDVNVTWFKDSNPVPDKAVLSNRNRNLTLTAVSKDEEGMYTCKATNPVSNATSNPSKISLAYGPNNVKLNQTGTVTLKLGSRLALLCTAESLPEAQFRWFFNHTNMNVTANTFSTDLTAWEDGGNYTCQAYNSVVKKLASASVNVKLTTQESTPPGSGLTPGQIVGIVIGCVLGVALIGGLGYFLFTKTALGPGRH